MSTRAALLGQRFQTRLTPRLVPVATVALTTAIALAGLAGVVVSATVAWWWGLLALLVALPLVVGLAALVRITGEIALSVLQMADDVAGIAERLPRLESTVDDVANEMPRLGFLRLMGR
ncbi:MAG TPA: DUF4282 domain-containing protein [Pseudonocardia sp.]